jgi:hypothetical protein
MVQEVTASGKLELFPCWHSRRLRAMFSGVFA